MNQEQVMDKLRKLLRLSESSNEHESALALQRAQELAIRHKIELASLKRTDTDQPAPAEPVGRVERKHNKVSMAHQLILRIIKYHFNVRPIYRGSASNYWLVGTRSDIEFAKYVFDFLDSEFKRLFQVAARQHGWNNISVRQRKSYYVGLYEGLSEKLAAAKQQQEKSGIALVASQSGQDYETVHSKYQLAIRDHTVAVNSAVRVWWPNLGKVGGGFFGVSGIAKKVTVSGLDAGRHDGARINISRPLGDRGGQARLR